MVADDCYVGPVGLVLLLYFTINGGFVGTRLGYCWIMIEERFPERSVGTPTLSLQRRPWVNLEGSNI